MIQQTSWSQQDLLAATSCTSLQLLSRTPAVSRERMPDVLFFFFILKVKNKKKGALAVFAFLAVLLTSTVLQKLNDEEKVTIVKFIGVFLVCFSS